MSLFALYQSPSQNRCEEYFLVLEAMGLHSQVVEHEGSFYLLVDEQNAEAAYHQLRQYVTENSPEEVLSRPLMPLKKGFVAAYLYALILLLFGALNVTGAFGIDWHQAGLADSWKIREGEWWRAVTALTLHADIAHLASNIGFGVLFGLLVSQHIGSIAAWTMILLAGSAGNLVNAYLQKSLHLSLGASTMVFAALGLLGVFALAANQADQKGMRRWLPFVATLALLAFTGTAGERTDVLAHLAGFACGCLGAIGWLWADWPELSREWRKGLALLSPGLLLIAWALAIMFG